MFNTLYHLQAETITSQSDIKDTVINLFDRFHKRNKTHDPNSSPKANSQLAVMLNEQHNRLKMPE